jgi:hypothetical protein
MKRIGLAACVTTGLLLIMMPGDALAKATPLLLSATE